MLSVGSLFSGIGGFDLGLERAGMRTVWLCEQDPFCRRVLAARFPGVPCHPDVRALVADARDPQPQEPQGHDSEHGERSTERRGQLVTAGARTGRRDRGRTDAAGTSTAGTNAAGLAGTGRDALPVPVPYVDVLCGGFPCQDISLAGKGAGIDGARSGLWGEYARLIRDLRPRYVIVENVSALLARGMGRVLGDLAACGYDAEWDCIPASAVGAPHRRDRVWLVAYPTGGADEGWPLDDALRGRHGTPQGQVRAGRDGALDAGWWAIEPDVGRVADGVPARVDRLRALGNALVPQVAELIGRRIIDYEEGGLADAA